MVSSGHTCQCGGCHLTGHSVLIGAHPATDWRQVVRGKCETSEAQRSCGDSSCSRILPADKIQGRGCKESLVGHAWQLLYVSYGLGARWFEMLVQGRVKH
jgi:hypothetical protein